MTSRSQKLKDLADKIITSSTPSRLGRSSTMAVYVSLIEASFCATENHGSGSNYPPYNIERTGENAYRISVAVAGFTDADLSIDTNENRLAIRGDKQANDGEKTRDVLYQGIAARTFERSFQLADHVEVKGASLENGLLHVDLVREIPEAMKPRSIPIASSSGLLEVEPTKVAA